MPEEDSNREDAAEATKLKASSNDTAKQDKDDGSSDEGEQKPSDKEFKSKEGSKHASKAAVAKGNRNDDDDDDGPAGDKEQWAELDRKAENFEAIEAEKVKDKEQEAVLKKEDEKFQHEMEIYWAPILLLYPLIPAAFCTLNIFVGSLVLHWGTNLCEQDLHAFISGTVALSYIFLALYAWIWLGPLPFSRLKPIIICYAVYAFLAFLIWGVVGGWMVSVVSSSGIFSCRVKSPAAFHYSRYQVAMFWLLLLPLGFFVSSEIKHYRLRKKKHLLNRGKPKTEKEEASGEKEAGKSDIKLQKAGKPEKNKANEKSESKKDEKKENINEGGNEEEGEEEDEGGEEEEEDNEEDEEEDDNEDDDEEEEEEEEDDKQKTASSDQKGAAAVTAEETKAAESKDKGSAGEIPQVASEGEVAKEKKD